MIGCFMDIKRGIQWERKVLFYTLVVKKYICDANYNIESGAW